MGRKPTEINPKRAMRIKELIEREGINQREFAARTHQTQQNVSRLVHQRIALTEEAAKNIVRAFPDYRIEWILGYDDSPTEYEWADHVQKSKDQTAESIWGIVETALNQKNKSLKFVHRTGQHVDSSERLYSDCWYSVQDSEGREVKRLTPLEMAQFEQKIFEFTDFMCQKYM